MRRVSVLAISLALLAGGCGDDSKRTASVATIPAKVPAGYAVHRAQKAPFTIAFPRSWQSLDAREALKAQKLKRFKEANPALRLQIQTLTLRDSPIKLIAVAPDSQGGFLTNFNLLVTRVPAETSFEDWTKAELAQLQKVQALKRFTHEETRLSPGQALHLTYRASFKPEVGPPVLAYVDQYLVRRQGTLYVLTYTAPPAEAARLRGVFERSARSFRLTG